MLCFNIKLLAVCTAKFGYACIFKCYVMLCFNIKLLAVCTAKFDCPLRFIAGGVLCLRGHTRATVKVDTGSHEIHGYYYSVNGSAKQYENTVYAVHVVYDRPLTMMTIAQPILYSDHGELARPALRN